MGTRPFRETYIHRAVSEHCLELLEVICQERAVHMRPICKSRIGKLGGSTRAYSYVFFRGEFPLDREVPTSRCHIQVAVAGVVAVKALF